MNKKNAIILIFITIILAWDIGNPDALRQGTEGFYLQIAKEMKESGNYLTPTYNGNNHWSKPPLHFWFASLSSFLGNNFLFTSRIGILLITLFSIIFLGRWSQRNLSTNLYTFILLFLSTIGIWKYSRIYMMEIPLTMLSCIPLLMYYDITHQFSYKKAFLISLFIALSVLIKGPVSFVMIFGTITLYEGYKFLKTKENFLIRYSTIFLLSLFFSSLWFYISYLKYGSEFFDYFFIRENMGKFTAKKYPVRVLFQGLFIFLVPLSFYFFDIVRNIKGKWSEYKSDDVFIFLSIASICFFVIWFIPNQKSHHYAMPATPYLTILLINFLTKKSSSMIGDKVLTLFLFLFIPILFLLLFFSINIFNQIIMLISIIFAVQAIIALIKKKNRERVLLYYCLAFIFTVNFSLPQFILPILPDKVSQKLMSTNQPVGTTLRKPFFIAEQLNRKVKHLNLKTIKQFNGYIILKHEDYSKLSLKMPVLMSWPKWKRNRGFSHIMHAIKANSLDSLREQVVLIER